MRNDFGNRPKKQSFKKGGSVKKVGPEKGTMQAKLDAALETYKSLTDKQRKELGLDDEQAPPFGGYHDIETPELIATYQYWDTVLDAKIKFNDEMTPKSDPTWYLVDKENWKELINKRINYDNNNIESKKAFINSSGDSMEEVDIEALEINYDKVIDKT